MVLPTSIAQEKRTLQRRQSILYIALLCYPVSYLLYCNLVGTRGLIYSTVLKTSHGLFKAMSSLVLLNRRLLLISYAIYQSYWQHFCSLFQMLFFHNSLVYTIKHLLKVSKGSITKVYSRAAAKAENKAVQPYISSVLLCHSHDSKLLLVTTSLPNLPILHKTLRR